MQHVEVLAGKIGSRPAGSPNQEATARYLSEQLRSWGYDPQIQEFPVRAYDDRGSRVTVIRPRERSVDANTVLYSPKGEIEAPVVHVGLGRAADLRGLDLKGKIALIRRGEIPFGEKVANAARAGAVGAIIYNNSPTNIQATLGNPGAIPAASISGVEGEALARELGADGTGTIVVRMAVDGETVERQGLNVVATKPGTRPGTIVIGGHMDSVPAGPGANDNASGTAVMLELARVFAARDYPYTLQFVAFGAEELGLFGSRYYVAQFSGAERRSTVAMINLDMVGVGEAWRFGGSDTLVQHALRVAADLKTPATRLTGPQSGASDHASFMAAGIPALFLYRVEDPNYHTAGDRPEHVDPVALGQAGEITLRVLEEIAGGGR